ncbi:MAG: alpha/beta fold hydrolase [Bacteroidia bacterium]
MIEQSKIRNIYLISGLGADWRLYSKLEFPPNTNAIHVQWIAPLKDEPLTVYAQRLSEKIDDTKPFYLVGLSFGGMIAVEMNKYIKPVKTIIISSAKTHDEVPWYYKMAGKFYLPQIVPMYMVKISHPLTYWYFGMKTKVEKALLKQVLGDMDNWFLKWALQQVTFWKNTEIPPNLLHIHGTADKVLPLLFASPHITIPGGEHLMVYSMADKISQLIEGEMLTVD